MYLYPILKKENCQNSEELIHSFKEKKILNKNNEEIGKALSLKETNGTIFLVLNTEIDSLLVVIEDNEIKTISQTNDNSNISNKIKIKDLESEICNLNKEISNLKKEKIIEKFDIKEEDRVLINSILSQLDESNSVLISNFEELIEKYSTKQEAEKNFKKVKNFI